jgi:serine/threonine protein kinase
MKTKRCKKVKGTLAYMAPEIKKGQTQSSHASDVYSIGILLWELFAGRRPCNEKGLHLTCIYAACKQLFGQNSSGKKKLTLSAVNLVLRATEKRLTAISKCSLANGCEVRPRPCSLPVQLRSGSHNHPTQV